MTARPWMLLALVLSLPGVAAAGDAWELYPLAYDPRFRTGFEAYGLPAELPGISARTAAVARKCGVRTRGVVLKVQDAAGSTASGSFALFADGTRLRPPLSAEVRIDPARLRSAGAEAFVSLASPWDPPASTGTFVLSREADGSLLASASVAGESVGRELSFPEDVPAVTATFSWKPESVSIGARVCNETREDITDIVAFPFSGSANLGAGIAGAKGDAAGFAFSLHGDLGETEIQPLRAGLAELPSLLSDAWSLVGAGNDEELHPILAEIRLAKNALAPAVAALPEGPVREEIAALLGAIDEGTRKVDLLAGRNLHRNWKRCQAILLAGHLAVIRAHNILVSGVPSEGPLDNR